MKDVSKTKRPLQRERTKLACHTLQGRQMHVKKYQRSDTAINDTYRHAGTQKPSQNIPEVDAADPGNRRNSNEFEISIFELQAKVTDSSRIRMNWALFWQQLGRKKLYVVENNENGWAFDVQLNSCMPCLILKPNTVLYKVALH